ncbi:glutathione S-transferase-like [Hyposmocoma kahamanoa]|uniref:glutathione S-transferase-like n=1 Tax=Hyposmocoma kahamanoa TaxID=1477025 RepID=UPI000E6D6B7D|nr:glutathione S-transferase-like [Hyposmocoma kahamanoa]
MAQKLYYFNFNGFGEAIRYILHYSGQKFEDIRYERKDWPIMEVKDKLPYGQMPLYEEGDRSLNQSMAIARYLASKTGLIPSDPWDQAVLDAIVLDIYDFSNKIKMWFMEQDPGKKEALKKEYVDDNVEFYFSRFEKHLKNNNGHFGGKLYWADFVLVGIVETMNLYFGIEIEKKYPAVQALIEKIRNLPGVKEYIANRKPYSL